MLQEYPVISIAMPCYNRGNNLEKFILNIKNQSYPFEKIEIVLGDNYSKDNTYDVATSNNCILIRDENPDMEYRRTLALKNCTGKYIFIADDDNFFTNPNLIEQMVELIEQENVSGIECVWEHYNPKDYPINRYCALLGSTDPTTFYLNMQDHLPYNYKKWILNGKVVKETETFYKIKMKPDEIPTMGCQGFLCRREDVLKAEKNGIILHMDICNILAKEGRDDFIFLKDYFGHNHVRNMSQLMKKLRRNIVRFNVDGKERAMNYDMNMSKMIKLGLTMGTFAIPLYDAVKGFFRIRDWAWFVHPIVCFRVTLMYTFYTLEGMIKKR